MTVANIHPQHHSPMAALRNDQSPMLIVEWDCDELIHNAITIGRRGRGKNSFCGPHGPRLRRGVILLPSGLSFSTWTLQATGNVVANRRNQTRSSDLSSSHIVTEFPLGGMCHGSLIWLHISSWQVLIVRDGQ